MGSEAKPCFASKTWEVLPQHILVSVFSYLTPLERLQAALACKTWNTCLQHPLLWRRFVCKFLLPVHEKVLVPVELHGHRIKALVIEVDQIDCQNRKNACKALNILAKNKERMLCSLTMHCLGQNPLFYAGQEFIAELKLLFGTFGDDLEPFSKLTHIDLSGLDIALDDSLFNILSDNHPGLEYLNIQNKSLVCKVSPLCLRHLVSKCKRLKSLSVFQLSLTDDVLTEIADQEAPCLQYLSILYRREAKYTTDLSSEAWSQLLKKIPTLRVSLGFDHTCPLHRICEVMKPEIPVTELRLDTFTRVYDEVNHATNCYHKTLEKMVLQTRNSEELEQALLRMAENCKRLNSLVVYCVLSESVVSQILELRPQIKNSGAYILKSRMQEGPWVVGAETVEEAQDRLDSHK
ncbi:F-box/LRR-repeat protein 8-like [Littorina saxatilis]|uniref:F-box domain-containing protein n=1 Tax=Littorina saxatilis TaxID=31220 RepID=A0AAN9BYX7_9CAEN